MSPIVTFLKRFSMCAAMTFFAPHAVAAVLILEGGGAQPSPQQPTNAAPALAPQEEPRAPAQSPPSISPAPAESGILAPATDLPKVTTPAPATTPSAAAQADPGTAQVANAAEVSIEMMPGQTVSVGSRVSFRVTSKKAGYVVLVDADASGHLTQIYPSTASLMRTNRPNGNFIKPGGTLTIPLATDPYAGFEYVVSPPNGQAMIIAILSAQPVQIVDLPDVPANIKDRSQMLPYLSKWINELRIPDGESQLREAKWSLSAKAYTIE